MLVQSLTNRKKNSNARRPGSPNNSSVALLSNRPKAANTLPFVEQPDAATGKCLSLASTARWSNLCPLYIVMHAESSAKCKKKIGM